MERIYLDHAATTPIHPDVLEAMIPVMQNVFGNPSSIHSYGREASKLLERARSSIAKQLKVKPNELIFTGGGTEADNLAIVGVAQAAKARGKGNHLITTEIEHHAVLKTCQYLEHQGFEVTYLKVNSKGRVSLDDLKAAVRPETSFVSIMYGNNEVGTLQPIEEIGAFLRENSILFHTDAVQAFGLVPMDLSTLPVDLLSMTGHKINGPKGVGLLYVRDGVSLFSHQHGGEQERKRRAGTQNVPGIIGLQKAIEIALETREEKRAFYTKWRTCFTETLDEKGITYHQNGDLDHQLPHVLNLYFPGTHVESLLMNLDLEGIAVSSGSACTAGSVEPSHVLTAMYGEGGPESKASIRISFGLYNTEETVRAAATRLSNVVDRLVKPPSVKID